MKKTPTEWLKQPKYMSLVILDPDGWDRNQFDASWAEPLTEQEFQKRVSLSTIFYPEGFLDV